MFSPVSSVSSTESVRMVIDDSNRNSEKRVKKSRVEQKNGNERDSDNCGHLPSSRKYNKCTQTDQTPGASTSYLLTSKSKSGFKAIACKKGEFVAVLNEEGSFWLCKTLQNVYTTSAEIDIRWLDDVGDGYEFHSYDTIDAQSIITKVSLKRKVVFEISNEERNRVMNTLRETTMFPFTMPEERHTQ